ncbi:hypothetical protein M0812_08326 [Anaeramoeba flamelloides]|uniref:Zinc finger PHD-type domain-containing protein n=1 Tax=Anaeramoeba flamelloides TaxID=1746091 RepID=A0AAV8A0F5_9EUKA|nr:hypothetical protein M0812_08326 [Anaeramoeba flamelloides]
MQDYWSLPSLLAEEKYIGVKFLKQANYLGFLINDPKFTYLTVTNENQTKIKNENENENENEKEQDQNKEKEIQQKQKTNFDVNQPIHSTKQPTKTRKKIKKKKKKLSKKNSSPRGTKQTTNKKLQPSQEFGDSEEEVQSWCCGKEIPDEDWVFCDNKTCDRKWFHYCCVGITEPPKGKWFCPNCRFEQLEAELKKQLGDENNHKIQIKKELVDNNQDNLGLGRKKKKKKKNPKVKNPKNKEKEMELFLKNKLSPLNQETNNQDLQQRKEIKTEMDLEQEPELEHLQANRVDNSDELRHTDNETNKFNKNANNNTSFGFVKKKKKIYYIPKETRTKLPLWLVKSLKWLRAVLIKIPFHYTQKFRSRVLLESELYDLYKKSEHYFYTGSFLAKIAMDHRISDQFSIIFTKRLKEIVEWALFWDTGLREVDIPWHQNNKTMNNNLVFNNNYIDPNNYQLKNENNNNNNNYNSDNSNSNSNSNEGRNGNGNNKKKNNTNSYNVEKNSESTTIIPAFEVDELEILGAINPSDHSLLNSTPLTAFTEEQALLGSRLTNLERVIHFFCYINSEKWRLYKERNSEISPLKNGYIDDLSNRDQLN